jgi:hypothetical protein
LPLDIGSLLPPERRREIRSLSAGIDPGTKAFFQYWLNFYDNQPRSIRDQLKEDS